MTFTTFGPIIAALGVAALAIGLFMVQRLRVRHRDLEVVTAQFWREAAEERRVWILMRQFRHWWAYLLMLAIASLIWLLIAGPEFSGARGTRHVILVDGSSRMQVSGRADEARRIAHQIARGAPQSKREVRLVAGTDLLVLAPGEPLPLLNARLEAVDATAAPPGFDAAVASIVASRAADDEHLHIHLVGNAPVREELRERLPQGVSLHRHMIEPALGENAAVVALGVAESASRNWRTIDVYAAVWPASLATDPSLCEASIDGRPLSGAPISPRPGELIWRDVPADGRTFAVAINANAALNDPADDRAEITLPYRPAIRVFVDAAVPQAIRDVLSVDSAVLFMDDPGGADIVISDAPDADFRIVPASDDQPALAMTCRDGIGTESIDALIDELAIRQIDAVSLASQLDTEIRLDVHVGNDRQVAVWGVLFDEAFDFSGSRAMPMFVSRAVRWLADHPPLVPWVAVDEPVAKAMGPMVQRPIAVGEFATFEGRTMKASLQVGAAQDSVDAVTEAERPVSSLPGLGSMLAAVLLVLLTIEWMLYQKGRVP